MIDEVRISSVVQYMAEFGPDTYLIPDQDTLALWKLDEEQGDIAADTSGNGHDGAVTEATWVKESPGAQCCLTGCPED